MGDPLVSRLGRPPEMEMWSRSPCIPPRLPASSARGGSGSTLPRFCNPAQTLRPWSLPRKNITLGRDATGVTLSGKKEGFALTNGAWVCNQSIQAGFRLDCTLDPRQAMGQILVCISAVQNAARRFQGSSLRVSTEGAAGEPRSAHRPQPCRSSWRGAGGSSRRNTGSIRAPAAQLRRWHEQGAMLLKSMSDGC